MQNSIGVTTIGKIQMITRLLPKTARTSLRTVLRRHFSAPIPLIDLMKYEPYHRNALSYMIPKVVPSYKDSCKLGLPIPPQHFWGGYGKTKEEYLCSGELHVGKMLELLKDSKASLKDNSHILDFGCAAGRMTRWLKNIATTCEIWGTDISAEHIYWCKQYLSPPFHFMTTTTLPHLPFEDRYFDFIYAGSVFTHIDDLADAWLAELRRILNIEGIMYITIHDNHTIDLFRGGQWDYGIKLPDIVRSDAKVSAYIKSNFGMFTIGRYTSSQVFYDIEYFCQMLKPFFKVISIMKEAYGFQTAVLVGRQ
jgi:ubiquinone/menaquinone biosynthesis C-methylase UbiE